MIRTGSDISEELDRLKNVQVSEIMNLRTKKLLVAHKKDTYQVFQIIGRDLCKVDGTMFIDMKNGDVVVLGD